MKKLYKHRTYVFEDGCFFPFSVPLDMSKGVLPPFALNNVPLKMTVVDEGYVVVYNWEVLGCSTSPRIFENVQLVSPAGKAIWTVNGMEKCGYFHDDVFVGGWWDDGVMRLRTFNGLVFRVNMRNGAVTYIRTERW